MPGSPTWSDIAGWYDQLVEAGSGPHETALACTMAMAGDVAGQTVLDIACGQGLATRALARAGAHVTGIDATANMLDHARRYEREQPLGIRYVEDDARVLATQADCSADGVNCQLGLMDIPDLEPTLAAVHRVLRPGGWFVFVIGHPCFLAPDAVTTPAPSGIPGRLVSGYFEERFWRSTNPQGVRRAGNHHRTLSTYLNGLVAAGFAIEAVAEPRPQPLLAEQQPEYASVPIFWATRARASATV
ncbi:MAG: class I SAM-dependent methyltransferase [Gaiellales bacterium]